MPFIYLYLNYLTSHFIYFLGEDEVEDSNQVANNAGKGVDGSSDAEESQRPVSLNDIIFLHRY